MGLEVQQSSFTCCLWLLSVCRWYITSLFRAITMTFPSWTVRHNSPVFLSYFLKGICYSQERLSEHRGHYWNETSSTQYLSRTLFKDSSSQPSLNWTLHFQIPLVLWPSHLQYHFRCGMGVYHDNCIPSELAFLLWQLFTSPYLKKNTVYCAEMTQKFSHHYQNKQIMVLHKVTSEVLKC